MSEAVRASRRRRLAAAVAVTGLVAALALASLAVQSSEPAADLNTFRRTLDDRLQKLETALHARLTDLARLPRLAAAVSTDPATVADLTEEELALRPLTGETIALGQMLKAASPVVLRVFPPGSAAPPLQGGPRARLVAGRLVLGHAVRIQPVARADELDGALAATWPVALDGLTREVTAAGAAAWLEGDGAVLAVVAPPASAGWARTALPLQSASARAFRLVVAAPDRPRIASGFAAAALALMSSLLLWTVWRARPARAPSAGPVSRTPEPSPPPALITPTPDGTVPSSAGSTVGGYQILRLLDAGGTAEVYLAREAHGSGSGKLVALKVLQSALAREPEVVELFLEEARLAARVNHPNVVRILDSGRAHEQYFIAMEYVEGADLDRLRSMARRSGRLIPVSVVLAILRRICDGLQAAHDATADDGTPLGLIHRDVKSSNVLLARAGAIKIGDFGIARASRALRGRRTDVGIVRGTPGFMAPEQRMDHLIDARTDIFGVGAIAYELLSSAPLQLDPLALGPEGWPHLRRPSALRPDCPGELDEVVTLALAFKREDRFQSCRELQAALEAIALRHPPVATDRMVAGWVESTLAADRVDPGRLQTRTTPPP